MVAGEGRAPVVENTHEPAVSDSGCDIILHNEGKAEPFQSCLQYGALVVEDELPLHAYADLAAVFLKIRSSCRLLDCSGYSLIRYNVASFES